jgi:hypothetical protein
MMIVPGKQLALNRVGDSEISTVELPRFPGEDQIVYETCIFSDNGTSNVVGRYENASEAHRAHNAIVQHELAHFMAKEIYQS